MALSASTAWEVRGGAGADTNGGAFVTGAAGTDYSQQDAKRTATGTDDSTTDAVANGTTTLTSATANFQASIVGNVIYLQGGTGALAAGWYQVTARGSATSITLDRAVAAGTGITMNIGGALATIATPLARLVAGNVLFVKASATYTISAGLVPGSFSADYATVTRIIGYSTTRNDLGRPVIQASAGITLFSNTTFAHLVLENLDFDGNSVASTVGVVCGTGGGTGLRNCIVRRMTGRGVILQGTESCFLLASEVTACGGSGGTGAVESTTGVGHVIHGNYIHDNTCTGIYGVGGTCTITRNVVDSNSGASSDGILAQYDVPVQNNTCYGNGRHGINRPDYPVLMSTLNNLLVGNGGYGLNTNVTVSTSFPNVNYNAFYNNTSGLRNGFASGPNDVVLTGDPFTNAAAGDFSLNNTASAGAAVRATGSPGSMPNAGGVGYLDIGALQHQDSGSSGGGLRLAGRGGLAAGA